MSDSQSDHLIVGRDAELARFTAIADRAMEGNPQFIAVEGPSGIGKTTLVSGMVSQLEGWRLFTLELDPEDREIPGSGLRRLLSVFGFPRHVLAGLDSSPESLVQLILDAVGAIDGPSAMVIEDAQWLDELSAEVLWRTAREMMKGRSITLVSYRPNTSSTFEDRVDRFLATGRRGEHFVLEPWTAEAVRDLLSRRLSIPVSAEIARVVWGATGGTPLLVSTIAEFLATAPTGQRDIRTALDSLTTSRSNQRRIFEDALQGLMNSLTSDQQTAVATIALNSAPIRFLELNRALGTLEASHADSSLLDSAGFAVFQDQDGSLRIAHPLLGLLIAEQIPDARRAQIHRALAEPGGDRRALEHRVRALTLEPASPEHAALVAELMEAGVRELQAREFEEGFTRFLWASWFSKDPGVHLMAVRAAVLAARPELLNQMRNDITGAPASRGRSAALGFFALAAHDLDEALSQISQGLQLPETDQAGTGTLVLAHALVSIGRIAYASGRFTVAAPVLDQGIQQLGALRAGLEPAIAVSEQAAALAVEIRSVETLLHLWSGLRHGDPHRIHEYVDDMELRLESLRGIPGTEMVQDIVTGIASGIHRQLGRPGKAYKDLKPVHDRNLVTREFSNHVAQQLGLLAFQAGFWDEAQAILNRAVEDCLFLPEDLGVGLTFAAAAVVPLARGERAEGEALLERSRFREAKEDGAVLTAYGRFAEALSATFEGDIQAAATHLAVVDELGVGWPVIGHAHMSFYARALNQTGQIDRLRTLAADLDRSFPDSRPEALAAVEASIQAQLHWADQDWNQAWQEFNRALDVFDEQELVRETGFARPGGGFALNRAFVALDAARLVAARSSELAVHVTWAAEKAREAAAFFLSCGAQSRFEEASELETVLLHIGELSSPDTPSGDDEGEEAALRALAYRHLSHLTSRERQITIEVADGLSNREIAKELFLSVRTVEFHVANVLNKLGLSSRVDLRHAISPAARIEKSAISPDSTSITSATG